METVKGAQTVGFWCLYPDSPVVLHHLSPSVVGIVCGFRLTTLNAVSVYSDKKIVPWQENGVKESRNTFKNFPVSSTNVQIRTMVFV